MSILIIEDERPLAQAVLRILNHAGHDVTWACDGVAGYEAAKLNPFDAILLDVLLPRKNGWQILEDLRADKVNTPVMMLTALDEVEEKVKGLGLGADDYLAKPFEADELVARANALLRRNRVSQTHLIYVDDMIVDRKERKVTRAGHLIRLTRREFDLLEALAVNQGRVLSRETIQGRVWTMDEAFSNTVEVFIGTLRKKIDAPFQNKLIHTQQGQGYVLQASIP